MKKGIFILCVLFLSGSVYGQLNVLETSTKKEEKSSKIIDPKDKFLRSQSFSPGVSFAPKTVQFEQNYKNGLTVVERDLDSRLPIFITGIPKIKTRSGNDVSDQCYTFLENAQELMQIKDPINEFKITRISEDERGTTHIRLQQYFHEIPIYGSEVIYHHNEKEPFLNGRYCKTPVLSSFDPSFDAQRAEEIIMEDVDAFVEYDDADLNIFDLERITSELVVYKGKLAYHLSVYESLIDLWDYFIDAHSGEILHKRASLCKFHAHTPSGKCTHPVKEEVEDELPNGPVISSSVDLFGNVRDINTYEVNGTFYMIDASRFMFDAFNSSIPNNPVGTIWTIDAFNTSPQNDNFQFDHVSSSNISFSGKPAGVSAHYNGGQAYLYFKNIHGRESIDANGGNIIALINISDTDGSSLGNAFWNGAAMFYGNGDNSFLPLARGLDVAGHEMSHGVIQSTANLEYQGESGALNESFADIFGAMIDREDWLIGEDVVRASAFPSGALRSLEDPHNGASFGDFNRGWQPKKYSERFTGSQDNGGVHINSGIPNHAFYLFANNPSIGKQRAEKVYYEVLQNYLTKSSQFIDARLAVVKVATEMYGSNAGDIAKSAFDQVEIFDGSGTNNQNDIEVNPGEDLILFTIENTDANGNLTQNNLYIADKEGNLIFNPLTEQNPINVPSITDDGTEIVFVNENGELYYIRLDWQTNSIVEEGVLGFTGPFRNVVFSRDGLKMAALSSELNSEIFVFDWISLSGTTYSLFNPTSVDSVTTSDVLYADALEFDFSGEYLMYDAYNVIESNFGNDLDYWDIGFIKVFDNDAGTFTLGTNIQKLFLELPEGVNIGNPTFSKNSDYIVAFDLFNSEESSVLGINIETSDIDVIFPDNDRLGYPSYSNDDDIVIFDAVNSNNVSVIGAAMLEENKIKSNAASVLLGFTEAGVKWGVWFGNGDRVLAGDNELLPEEAFDIYPNPVVDHLTIMGAFGSDALTAIRILDAAGKVVYNDVRRAEQTMRIDVSSLPSGYYVLHLISEEGRGSKPFVKP